MNSLGFGYVAVWVDRRSARELIPPTFHVGEPPYKDEYREIECYAASLLVSIITQWKLDFQKLCKRDY